MTQSGQPHRVIVERMKKLRRKHDWSAQRLAEEMTRVGIAWDRSIVANLENGRRATISVEELLALAYVLSVAPIHLMVPPVDADDLTPYRVTPAGNPTVPSYARAWIRGQSPIGEVDAKLYFSEVPDSEWQPPSTLWPRSWRRSG